MNEMIIDFWVFVTLACGTSCVIGFVSGSHGRVPAEWYSLAHNKVLELMSETSRLRGELEACWQYINADTQLKRKKEEAKKPRDSNGRFARKC